jgi:hypothetical protein
MLYKKHKADLIQNMNIHSYNTRINMDFHVKFCRTSLFKKKNVVYIGTNLYSKAPNEIKNSGFFSFQKRFKIIFIKTFLLYDK